MKTYAATHVHRTTFHLGAGPVPLLLGALLLAVAAGCGPLEERSAPPMHLGGSTRELTNDNGLIMNGLAFNGLAFNGLAFNGLAFNGLSTSEFSTWFQQDPTQADLLMRYLVRCSVPDGETRTYSDGTTTYTWPGYLGLAPDWSSGAPMTLEEQQIVTACLAALTNKYSQSVRISVLGANARGEPIPYTASELADYSQREACFFGNIFTHDDEGNPEGFFVGNDQPLLPPSKSSLRACALASTNGPTSSACPPLVHIGDCQASCELDSTGTYYTRCTRNGITYRPITTRIHPEEIFTCGDGVCQPSESCGSNTHANDCGVDCGACTAVSSRTGRAVPLNPHP
jgi:hypothetical protein